MSAGNLNLSMNITARDNSRSAFQSAISGIQSLARTAIKPITIPFKLASGGLGFLRDINQGLAPLVRGIDALVDRGTALGVQSKAFQSLTGQSAGGAQALARRLVDASSGTLRLAEAMQIANRAIGAGMNLEQVGTAIDFISKKAVATGKNASEAISTVITGLSRGSTLFLDDFGILVDGIDGVKRRFDQLKGIGAFDALGPAAQKAEIIRQALDEMTAQSGKLNINTRDVYFQWQGLKNAVGDASDRILQAVAGTKALSDAVAGAAGFARSLADFLGSGGDFSLAVVDSLNVLKGFALDFGEVLARSLVSSMMTNFRAAAPKLADMLGITEAGITKIQAGMDFSRTRDASATMKLHADQQRAINGQGAKPGGGGPGAANQAGGLSKKQSADLDRERKIITGDTNFAIRRGAAKRADDEIRARRAKGERVPYSERDKLVAQYREEETNRRLAENDAKRNGVQGPLGGIDGLGKLGGRDPLKIDDLPLPPELQPRELGPSRPNPGDAAARVTKEREQTTRTRKGAPALSDAEKAARRKRQARNSVETLPAQIAKNVARLRANYREGFMGGYMGKDDQDALIRQTMHDIETLDRDARISGTEKGGFGLENYRLKDGQTLSEYLNKFEDYLQRERSEVEPFSPSHPMRQRSVLRDRVRAVRRSSQDRATRTYGESYESEFQRFMRLSDEQGRLTRDGVRDMDREGIRGNQRRGIGMIEKGTAMEPLIRQAMDSLKSMDRRASELMGISKSVIESIHGLTGVLSGENAKLNAIARG
ncbi:MAG: hypothetical protein HZA51_15585 [Planctomycetes bacterium]|nr:hypothetical protein [Planctomycetota bacterium]